MTHILYIEDDPDSVILVKKVLESRGYSFMWAFNGQEGLNLCRAGPGLILLDIRLPDMSGYEVARSIRSCGKSYLMYVPIIAITAHDGRMETKRALEAGCDVFMTKPLNLRELLARVEAFLPSHTYPLNEA
ncbi:MAG: response regulator transcription factor [Chloroflexi bacterium]|nr:response regulator transcription factor [Chloroflexota bacterium]